MSDDVIGTDAVVPVIGSVSPAFASAIVKAQGNIEGAKKGKNNPAFRSKYADLAAVWDACSEALQEAGIAVLQFPVVSPPGYVGLCTVLVHGETGETLAGTFNIPLKDANNAQAAGSAITYARRYALSSVIGICPEDDDGNGAVASPKVSQPANPVRVAEEPVKPYLIAWEKAETIDQKKVTFKALKSSSVAEPGKTQTLKEWSDSIKAQKAAEDAKETK